MTTRLAIAVTLCVLAAYAQQKAGGDLGPMVYRQLAHYRPHAAELPLMLQDHNTPVHYRNIWIRKIGAYDRPEK
jgi:hypothetical protein